MWVRKLSRRVNKTRTTPARESTVFIPKPAWQSSKNPLPHPSQHLLSLPTYQIPRHRTDLPTSTCPPRFNAERSASTMYTTSQKPTFLLASSLTTLTLPRAGRHAGTQACTPTPRHPPNQPIAPYLSSKKQTYACLYASKCVRETPARVRGLGMSASRGWYHRSGTITPLPILAVGVMDVKHTISIA